MKFLRLTLILMTALSRARAAEQASHDQAGAIAAVGATPSTANAAPTKPATGKAPALTNAESRSVVPAPQAAAPTTKSTSTPPTAPATKKSAPKAPAPGVAEAPAPSRKNDAAKDSVNIAELREKAIHGNTIAQYNLGLAYSQGLGVPVNLPEAYVWFSLASEKSTTGKAFERLVGGMSNVQVNEGNKHLVVVRDPANASAVASSRMIANANPKPEPVHVPDPEPSTTLTLKSDPDPAPGPNTGTTARPVVKKPAAAEEIVPLFRPNRTAAEIAAAAAAGKSDSVSVGAPAAAGSSPSGNRTAASAADPASAKSAAAVPAGESPGAPDAPAGGAGPATIALGGGIPPEAAQRTRQADAA